jgi:TolB-like protein/Tfp pilus assembly protein PilF
MGQFFQELKRRKVDRVVIAYVAVAWLVLQVAEMLLPVYGFTDVAIRNFVAVLGIGLIVTSILSWSFEWTPEGIFRDSAAKPVPSDKRRNTKGLDRFIIAALTAAVAFFAIDKFVLDPARDAQEIEAAAEQARADALAARKDQSVAVLPFANRSNGDDDIYFVDGIHDDILNQLARIDALSVTSRTSVEQYRDTTQTIPEIGAELGVTAILEGGVQRAGDRVRINVQLINAANDDHLWAETYERELTAANIFSVQADISTKVADALRVALLPDERIMLAKAPTESYEAYDLYLLGRYHWNQRTNESIDLAQQYFEQAIEADPEFVLALSGLADSYVFQAVYGTRPGDEVFPLAREVIDRAIALDDESSEVWASLGLLNRNRLQYTAADDAFRRAIDLDDKNSSAWFWYAQSLWRQHRYADALAAGQTAYALEPMSYVFNRRLGTVYRLMGDFEMSRQHLRRAAQVAPSQSFTSFVPIMFSYYWSGEYFRAIEDARTFLATTPNDLGAIDVIVRSSLDLSDVQQAEVWTAQGYSIAKHFRIGFLVFLARNDYRSAISYLEETLEIQQPHRHLPVLYELFRAHLNAGDEAIAREYLNEFVDAQQGRIEVEPRDSFQLVAMTIATYWIQYGDDTLSETDRGRELAEEVRSKMTALKDQGWLHPQMFVSLAAANASLGDHDAAFANLHEAIDSGYRNQESSLSDLPFDSLRDDPRFVEVMARINQYLADERVRLASIELPPYTPPVQREIISLTREQLESFVGWYSDRNALVQAYIDEDGRFMGRGAQDEPNQLLAIAHDEFQLAGDRASTIQFVTDETGVATHFLIKGGFGEVLYKRVAAPPATIELPRDVLARYEGSYSHDRMGDLEGERAETDIWGADIYVDDDGVIWVDYDDQPRLEIRAISESEFDLIGFDTVLIFEPDPDTGAVDHFIHLVDGREVHFYRD